MTVDKLCSYPLAGWGIYKNAESGEECDLAEAHYK